MDTISDKGLITQYVEVSGTPILNRDKVQN